MKPLCWVVLCIFAAVPGAHAQSLGTPFWLVDTDRSSHPMAIRGHCREAGDKLTCEVWVLRWQSPLSDANTLMMLQMEEREGPGASLLCRAMPYGRDLLRLGRAEDMALFNDLQISCLTKDKQIFNEALARYRARLGEICEVVEVAGEVSLQRVADGRWAGGPFPVCNAKRTTLEYDKTGEWRLGLESDDAEIFDWCLGSSTNGRAFYRGGTPKAILGLRRKCDAVMFPRG